MAIPINSNSSLIIPTQSFDSVWVQSITITAPNPTRPIQAQIRVCPLNSTTGVINPSLGKPIIISNISSASFAQTEINNAMGAILTAVQALITSGSISF